MSQDFDLQAIGYKVFSILTENPGARDDDKLLLVEIWSRESKAKDIASLMNEILVGSVSFPDTVTRVRRKLQEKHESLRGELWDARHNLEEHFCKQLTFFDKW